MLKDLRTDDGPSDIYHRIPQYNWIEGQEVIVDAHLGNKHLAVEDYTTVLCTVFK